MSVVRVHRPENRLGKLLRVPGGVAAADALAQAGAGLAGLAEPARAQLEVALAAAGAAAARLTPARDPALIAELYDVAREAVGLATLCQRPAVETVLQSLCDLLDHLSARELWDAQAIAVHVHAFRLLMAGEKPEEGGAAGVLDGLKQVSRRFAADD